MAIKVKHSARVEIYGLFHPCTDELRYIGKANNANKRLLSHLRDMYRRNYPVYLWMRKLRKDNRIPIMKVLKITNSDNWVSDEQKLIKCYRNKGCNLLNVAKGGDEPFCSTEVRAKNGVMVARMIHDNPRRKKLWYLITQLGLIMSRYKKEGDIESYNKMVFKIKIKTYRYPSLSSLNKYDYI